MGNSLPHGKIQPRLPSERKESLPERRPLDERRLGNPHANGLHDENDALLALRKEAQAGDPLAPPQPVQPVTLPSDVPAALARHIGDLTKENAQLHELLEQARERLQQGEKDAEQWKAREQEYETLLEEKSEVIRQLHAQNQERAASGQGIPTEDELVALQQELERERELLKQDEESMMAQMREMEMQMARERADFARQRSELQRLQTELRHELEIASRDAALRERLGPLYKLQEEMQRRRVGHDPSQRSRG